MSGPISTTSGEPDPKYARLASEDQVQRTAARLREHGFEVVIASTSEEARREVLSRIAPGSEVFEATSRTLEETGLTKALAEAPGITRLRPQMMKLDRKTQSKEIRKLTQLPDVIVGSVHALTEDGQVLAASATGSQLGPYAHGAGRVIWVVGTQKIVPTLEEGLRRIERYALPLEDGRAHQAYGIGSSINRILIFRREFQPGRVTIVLVKERLGF